jgi:hypothetical protein
VALWTKLPVKLLSLNVVAKMVAVTRMSCEDRAGETDLKAYCMNYVGNNYEREAPARGVRVFTANPGGASGRSAKEFYMCFAPDADTSCLKSLLAVQRLKHDFEDPASKYESLSFAVDMYARSAHARGQAPSLASEVLGLGELGQARPNKNDVHRLLKRIANIDNVSRGILALSSSGKPPPPRAGSGSTRGRWRTPTAAKVPGGVARGVAGGAPPSAAALPGAAGATTLGGAALGAAPGGPWLFLLKKPKSAADLSRGAHNYN